MLEKYLKKYFNFSRFLPGQKEIVENIMAGRDVVALMPTGGGKSLCYQLPAVISGQLTVVISPLIALMKDQVDSLNSRGINATFINSSLNDQEMEERISGLRGGRTKILYIAPERFSNSDFSRLFETLKIYLLAIDEAHCVSQWGHDFRPDYLSIKDHIKELKKRPIVAAFTATATPEVKNDIITRLELKKPEVFVRGFDRPNLKFFVRENLSERQRIKEALRIINSIKGSGIVYTLTRKETEDAADFFKNNGIPSAYYHAGMRREERTKIQNDFMENKFRVIVATIAFGMGIDKADIRFVIHAGMPSSLEGYYQEAGRAGRDGEAAYCILLHSPKDVGLHYHFIVKNKEGMISRGKAWDEVNRISGIKYQRLEKMKNYVMDADCRRKAILEYFNDPAVQKMKDNCRGCDICLNFQWEAGAKPRTVPYGAELQDENYEMENNFTIEDGTKDKDSTKEILSSTVQETVKLYRLDYSIEQIAKMRNLGANTIFNHLVKWYLSGGELETEKFIAPNEEKQILLAMSKTNNYQKLKSIKEQLPESIGYEKIRLVIAKIQRIGLM